MLKKKNLKKDYKNKKLDLSERFAAQLKLDKLKTHQKLN